MRRYIIYNSCNFGLSEKLMENAMKNTHAIGLTVLENPGTAASAASGNKWNTAKLVLRSAKKASELKNADNTGAGTDTPAPGNQQN